MRNLTLIIVLTLFLGPAPDLGAQEALHELAEGSMGERQDRKTAGNILVSLIREHNVKVLLVPRIVEPCPPEIVSRHHL